MIPENEHQAGGAINSQYLCPCGSDKNFESCHKPTGETLIVAIHEIGHAVSLPSNSGQHVSFWSPCPHCGDEGEAKPSSLAHTSYAEDVQFSFYELVLYTLAGGASEIASGCKSTLHNSGFGDFPASMGYDFDDLRDNLEHYDLGWQDAVPYIPTWFAIVVKHLTTHVPKVRALALELIQKRSLTHEEADFGFLDREQLLREIQEVELVE